MILLLACAPDPVAGASRYDLFCSSCHGSDGAAGVQVDGVTASDLMKAVPMLDDATLQSVIQDGYGAMPAQRMDDPDALDLIAYLREAFPAE